jgi:hypothetical protein
MKERTTVTTYDERVPALPEPDDVLALSWTPPGDVAGVDVWLALLPDGRWRLSWGDQVINVWTEVYDDPAVALARAAVLVRCATTGGFFRHQAVTDPREDPDGVAIFTEAGVPGPAAFITDATAFLDAQLSVPAPGSEVTP